MKKSILSIIFILFTFTVALTQTYTTPNTGVVWTLDDLAAASPSTITVLGTDYTLLENLVIAENDEIIIDSDLTLFIDADLLVTVYGAFTVDSNAVSITALDQNAPYEGFRFEQGSFGSIVNATIEYGGGLRVLTENFSIDNCTLSHNVEGATTSAVIQLSRGMPQVTNNTISFNDLAAIGSAANSQVSAYIYNNYIEGNNQENSNRPQINMGTTRNGDPLQIVGNTVIGDRSLDMVGGIAVANLVGGNLNVEIDNNTIKDNRYGLAILGSVDSAFVRDNVIEDNDTQGDPGLGGSGINVNTSTAGSEIIANGNALRRNLWGITLQGDAVINLGDDAANPGMNVFSENGNNSVVYALYNNTANTISAKHNCWIEGQQSTEQQVEDVIFHKVDDPSLGEVIFNPFECGTVGIVENTLEHFNFYPNPVKNEINFNNVFSFEKAEIYGMLGDLISTKIISEGDNTLPINLASGVYFVKFANNTQAVTKKMIVE